MVNWSKMCCRQGQATRRKTVEVCHINKHLLFLYIQNNRECQRGNASKAI